MKVHLIGIGGAGVSALGNLYLGKEYEVSGSDTNRNRFTDILEKKGVKVIIGHKADLITKDLDLVVYSNAIPKHDPDNVELAKARELGVEVLSYPEALGRITKEYTTIAVSGTHGKTTTTAMLLHILQETGLSPTGIVGSLLSSSGSNYVEGDSNILVIEADEYMKAFLNHSPTMIGVTNIDHDHHDIYPTLQDLQDTFKEFANNLPELGILICSALDQNSWDTFEDLARTVIDYSVIPVEDLSLKVPGAFNRRNAQLAIALAIQLDITLEDATKSLESFKGTWRRQEFKGEGDNGRLVYDDYAHHPTEIMASLSGFRELYPNKKITVIFQPHLYSRTKNLYTEFCNAFNPEYVDQVILLPVYAAREEADPEIDIQVMAQEINNTGPKAMAAADFQDAITKIDNESEVIVTMGAGDVTELSNQLVSRK